MSELPSDQANPATNIVERTVSELSGALKRMVEDNFGLVRVRGEIGRVSRPGSGHIYLDLKDDRAVLAAVIWKGNAARMKTQPEQGLEVIATGKLTTFPGQSKYQIVIEALEPAGAGALMALLEERKRKLEADGLFSAERKQLLPYMPRVIGVVTSPSGAVIRDVLHRITDRFPLHVIVWPVRVQGETCGDEVAAAIRGFNALEPRGPIARPDLIIVARGGGSIEDLWGFNDEGAVRAAAQSDIPLISAVGHETDWTLIDLAADLRAPTPTGAAEIAVPVKAELEATLASLSARLKNGLTRKLDRSRSDLRAASRALGSPDEILSQPRQQLDNLSGRLSSALTLAAQRKRGAFGSIEGRLNPALLRRSIEARRGQLNHASRGLTQCFRQRRQEAMQRFDHVSGQINWRRLERVVTQSRGRLDNTWRLISSLSHEKVLARGFALVRAADGTPVTSAGSLKPGSPFAVQFKDGTMDAVAASSGTARPTSRPDKPAAPRSKQGDLF